MENFNTINGQSAAKPLSDDKSYEEGSTTIPQGSTETKESFRKQPLFNKVKIYTLKDPITQEIRYIWKYE